LGSVVVEAPGWNDAIYFAGLGMDGEYVNPKTPDTGELADISNLVFRAPNPEQGYIAHIGRATPRIHHCELQGGIWISGCKPKLTSNTIRWSRSCGVKITDRAAPELSRNVIHNNKFGGIKVKRSAPVLARNTKTQNQSYGMVITTDSAPLLFDNNISDQLDQPKFNPLAGLYGPLQTPQVCGFCGSTWVCGSGFGSMAELLSGSLKTTAKSFDAGIVEHKVTLSAIADGERAEAERISNQVHSEPESKVEWSPALAAAYFINHACLVDPGEISSDDEQLYGDDDLGTL